MLAVLYVLLTEGLVDRAFIAAHTDGFDQLELRVGPGRGEVHTPAWAAALRRARRGDHRLCPRIRRGQTGHAPPRLFHPARLCRRGTVRLAIALQIATGNFGGGAARPARLTTACPRVGRLPVRLPRPACRCALARRHSGGTRGRLPHRHSCGLHVGGNFVNQGADAQEHGRLSEGGVHRQPRIVPHPHRAPVRRCLSGRAAFEKEDIGIPWGQLPPLQSPGCRRWVRRAVITISCVTWPAGWGLARVFRGPQRRAMDRSLY